ncbi:hypothetical protein ADEAN_000113700 [Angomonas deanei]|uniref:Uncharacterized protein n=1 Tax=Angomonas deanei TaxID=59799 RepID=A0A7G2C359_9TRYP|nr:hypothetical protein ADEAN_000113700 [Angomonas deanei]
MCSHRRGALGESILLSTQLLTDGDTPTNNRTATPYPSTLFSILPTPVFTAAHPTAVDPWYRSNEVGAAVREVLRQSSPGGEPQWTRGTFGAVPAMVKYNGMTEMNTTGNGNQVGVVTHRRSMMLPQDGGNWSGR